MDYSPPGSSLHGISQARILERVAISFFKGSSSLRNQTRFSCIALRILNRWATREAQYPNHFTKKKPSIYSFPIFSPLPSRPAPPPTSFSPPSTFRFPSPSSQLVGWFDLLLRVHFSLWVATSLADLAGMESRTHTEYKQCLGSCLGAEVL